MSAPFVELGLREVWGGQQPLRLYAPERRRHVFITGQTGVGKSTLIQNIVAQDIANGHGVALLDPHGDLSSAVLDFIPGNRVDDVIIIDPTDLDRPVGFNPFYRVPPDERALVAANITATFKHQWRDSWGPRLEYILFNVCRALLDAPDNLRPSFIAIPLVLVNADYRQRLVRHIGDPRVRSFFSDEFETWNERYVIEAIGPVQNKIGQFLANPMTRNILGQWKPSMEIGEVLEDNRILILRLPKGLIGDEAANLFGSFIVSAIQQAAMRRAARTEAERSDFHLVIDEFANFTNETFASILSESRKYGLTLTIGSQYLDQASQSINQAIFGNVGSIIAFRVSADDADRLAREIGSYPPPRYRELERGDVLARIAQAGTTSISCIGKTFSEPTEKFAHAKNIWHQSRIRYGNDRHKVENRIARWLA